ncbi:alpha/beta hydrolase [Azorhizobium sp. AG788]|uniref:alpha/beta fold hydrolase n=1 Tax=Azorhizobium sp. AG788 TaxID=2183897 RepID=UPI003139E2B6
MSRHRTAISIGVFAVTALAAMAVFNRMSTRRAEEDNPPTGQFIDIDGVKLHYTDHGTGPAIVFLHGNGAMVEDFQASGLLDAISDARVIAFDRPGFGHSRRPRSVIWTPSHQADLIHHALARLGVTEAILVGHSWGALLAATMAVRHPTLVKGLVLASGYYFPSARLDGLMSIGGALPIVGDLLSQTLSPLIGRLIWGASLRKIFGPARVPEKFEAFPTEMALRPSQLRAAAVETTLMVPAAAAVHRRYGELTVPVVIIAGADDRLVDFHAQSHRLHEVIKHSTLRRVANCGHMVHQTATDDVLASIATVRERIAG